MAADMTSPAIKLAKECGAESLTTFGNEEVATFLIRPHHLETFYAKAQAQALRDAAKRIVGYGEAAYIVNEMADELERAG